MRGRSEGDWRTSAHTQKIELGGEAANSITGVSKDSMILEYEEIGDEQMRRSEQEPPHD